MYYKTTKTLAAAVLITLAFGCKREALTENPRPVSLPTGSAPTVTHLQQWVKNHPLSLSAQGRTAGNNLPKHTLLWGQASYDAAGHAYTVPLLLAHEGAAQSKLRAALVATEGADGQITGGQYMLTLPQGNAPAQYPKQGQEAPGYNGAVLYYNMQGQLTADKVYKDGRVLAGARAALVNRPATNLRPPKNCDETAPCIDWYWQTYVNGVLVDEVYLYTTCPCPTGGGSGTGIVDNEGPSITSCERTQAQAQSIIAGIETENINVVTSSFGPGIAVGPDSVIRRNKQEIWDFLKLRLYLDFHLRYTIVFNGVVYKNNTRDTYWKWESLREGQLMRTGTMAPCMSVDFSYTVPEPIISADKKLATTSITYAAIASVPCLFGVEVGTYSGGHPYVAFHAND
jgi:hypothetical protein